MSEPKSETTAAPSTPGELAGQNGAAPANSTATRDDNPYVGPRPIKAGKEIYGRKRETSKLFDRLIAERIVLLHSPSGAGKSSLINAALLPLLRAEGFAVLPIMRVSGDTQVPGANRYVINALQCLEKNSPDPKLFPNAKRLSPEELATLTLDDYLTQRALIESAPAGAPEQAANERYEVLIFDQFEEILTQDATDKDVKDAFFKQVGKALQKRHRWALFVVREDYLGALEPYAGLVPTRLSNRFRLDLLNHDAARQAMQGPAQERGVTFSDAAAEQLIGSVTFSDATAKPLIEGLAKVKVQGLGGEAEEKIGPYVEPVQLQVVCHRLWEKWQELEPQTPEITPEHVKLVGNIDKALSEFYAEKVKAIAKESVISERALRQWFDSELITPQGIRSQVMQDAKDTLKGINDEAENKVIDALLKSHLVRVEERRGVRWFELAHDRLVDPVRASNTEWFKQHLVPLQTQAPLWEEKRDPGLLLRGREWKKARRWADTHPLEITPVEKEFFEASRLYHRSQRRNRVLFPLIGLVYPIFFIWILFEHTAWLLYIIALTLVALIGKSGYQRFLRPQLVRVGKRFGVLWFKPARENPMSPTSDDNETRDILPLLQSQATLWASQGGNPHQLLGGQEWKKAQRWAAKHPQEITPVVEKFVEACRLDAHSRQQRRMLQGGLLCSLFLLLMSLFWSNSKRHSAVAASRLQAVSLRLAAQSRAKSAQQPELALLLGIEAWKKGDQAAETSIDPWLWFSQWNLNFHDAAKFQVAIKPAYEAEVQKSAGIFGEANSALFSALSQNPQLIGILRIPSNSVSSTSIMVDGVTAQFVSPTLPESASTSIMKVAVSKHGRFVVAVDFERHIWLWDVESKKPGSMLELEPKVASPQSFSEFSSESQEKWRSVLTPAFSPNGQTLVTADKGKLALWDTKTRKLLNKRPLAAKTIYQAAFTTNRQLLVWAAPGSGHGVLYRFDAVGTGPLRRLGAPKQLNLPRAADFSASNLNDSGSRLVTQTYSHEKEKVVGVTLWNTTTGHRVRKWPINHLSSLALSGNGQRLAFAFEETGKNRIEFWGGAVPTAPPQTVKCASAVYDLIFSPDGKALASTHTDGSLMLRQWRKKDGFARAQTLKGQDKVSYLAFSRDGGTLATVGQDRSLFLWDVNGRRSFGRPLSQPAMPKPKPGAAPKNFKGIVFSPDGKMLRSYDDKGRIIAWNLATGSASTSPSKLRVFPKQENDDQLVCSADGKWLARCRKDGTIEVQSLVTGKPRTPLFPHTAGLALAFSPQSNVLAIGDYGPVVFGDLKTGVKRYDKSKKAESWIYNMAFSANGKWLASRDGRMQLQLWEVSSGKLVDQCAIRASQLSKLAVASDGKTVAVVEEGFDRNSTITSTIRLWKPEVSDQRNAAIQALNPDAIGLDTIQASINSLAFSPRSTLLASGNSDGTVRVWNMATQQPIGSPLVGHGEGVSSVAFGPEGWSLASVGKSGSVRLWDMALQKRAFNIVNRNLTQHEWQRYIGDDSPYPYTIPMPPPGK